MPDVSAISIQNARKDYGAFTALHSVSFDIADNEFFTLLGPSGCGKTTLLRMIAGFEEVTAGEIFLYGDEIENLRPDQRPVNTVFQNYALFPHMSVSENIAFAPSMLGWSKKETDYRVQEMLRTVKLEAFANRKPSQLSGGQQQRVALARAMAPRPKVLLLDEPLSALDLKLRQEMRAELKNLQRDTGITFVFVTHDQEEALSMSDRIAVMSEGEVQQIGTAKEIYEFPANRFVADFIGDTNLVAAKVNKKRSDGVIATLSDGSNLSALVDDPPSTGTEGWISIRPERMMLDKKEQKNTLTATITSSVYIGTDTQYGLSINDTTQMTVRMQNSTSRQQDFKTGDRVYVSIEDGAARFLTD